MSYTQVVKPKIYYFNEILEYLNELYLFAGYVIYEQKIHFMIVQKLKTNLKQKIQLKIK